MQIFYFFLIFWILLEESYQYQSKFLIVGQRWDMEIHEPLNFTEGWQENW